MSESPVTIASLQAQIAKLHSQLAAAERQLQELQSDRTNQILDSLPQAIAITSWDGKLVHINRRFTEQMGYRPEEVLGQKSIDTGLWAEQKARETLIQHLQQFGSVHDQQIQLRHRSGQIFTCLVSAKVVPQGEQLQIIESFTNITSLKAKEATPSSSEDFFCQIAENLSILFAISTIDDHQIIYISPAYDLIFGRHRDELYDNPLRIFDYIQADDRHHLISSLNQRPHQTFMGEIRIFRPDGEMGWLHCESVPIRDSNGQFYCRVGAARDITEQKKLELSLQQINQNLEQVVAEHAQALTESYSALQKRETQLCNIAQNIPSTIFQLVFCPDGTYYCSYISKNPIHQVIWGFSAEEIIAEPSLIKQRIYPEDYSRFTDTVLAGPYPSSHTLEYRYHHPSGITKWISAVFCCTKTADGRVVVDGVATNISDRKQIENTLIQSEITFRSLFESSPVGIALVDLNTHKIFRANSAFQQLLGYSAGELLQMTPKDITHPEDYEQEEFLIQAVILKQATSYKINKRYIKKNQEIVWVRLTSNLIPDADGNYLYGLGIAEDITDLKLAEESLKQSEARYRAIVQTQREIISRSLPDTTVTFVNEAILYYGVPSAELIGIKWMDAVHLDDQAQIRELIERLSPDSPYAVAEYRAITIQYPLVWFRTSFHGIFDEAGQLQEIQAVAHDVTEQKQMAAALQEKEASLYQSLQEKEVLLREMHHRVKNNLQVISSLLRSQGRSSQNPDVASAFKQAHMRIQSMALIHEQLYQSNRHGEVDFGYYANAVVHNLVRFYSKEPVAVEVATNDIYLPLNLAIPCGLIINELCTNSLKHAFTSKEPKEIKISLSSQFKEDGLWFTLSVVDNGVGITQPAGLGLQIVSDLADQLSGTLEIVGDRSGKVTGGTGVNICFPAADQSDRVT